MRTIGLIGGMSFESTALYYRKINEAVNRRLGKLSSAEILLHSVNFQSIVELQQAGNWQAAGIRLANVARGLKSGGADCLLICAVTMHIVADAVADATDLPLIHNVDETAKRLKLAGHRRPLLLATRYTMEGDFYPERMQAHDIEIVLPDANARAEIHRIIFEELTSGKVLDASRDFLISLIETAKRQGADSVILGCTEICMILDPDSLSLPGFDSTQIHVDAAVAFALDATD